MDEENDESYEDIILKQRIFRLEESIKNKMIKLEELKKRYYELTKNDL